MSTNTNTGQTSHARWYYCHFGLALLVLLMFGMTWRMQNVTSWPIPFHPMLQYENALNTRALWYQWKGTSASESEKTWLAGYTSRWKGVPISEAITAFFYLKIGLELPFIAVAVQAAIFLLMSMLFFDIARRYLHSWIGAVGACAFLLLHSFLVAINQSYQHETVALLGFVAAWWLIARYRHLHVLWLGVLGGLLLLTKPGIYWIPWCALMVGYSVERRGWRETLRNPSLLPALFLGLLPSLLWMKFILTSNETHQWKWQLLFTSEWYITTFFHLGAVLGWVPLILMVIYSIQSCMRRRWVAILYLLGCMAYSLLFSYATMTHDYYLLPFFPLAALACGHFFVLALRSARLQNWSMHSQYHRRIQVLIICFAYVLIVVNLGFYWPSWGNYYGKLYEYGPYRPLEATCKQLGDQLGIGTKVIALTNDYAMPLRYFSGLHAEWWPTAGDLWYEGLAGGKVKSAVERLAQLQQRTKARYFIVTLHDELAQQTELQELLQQYVEMPSTIEGVRIFDLSQRR